MCGFNGEVVMRLFIGSLFFLIFMTNSVYGQFPDLKVDNSTMSGSDIDQVFINQQGQLTVISRDGIEFEIIERNVAPGDVAISSFTINNATSTSLAVGATATVRWNTSDADTCSASATGPVSLSDWNATTVVGTAGPATVTFSQAGVYNLQLNCEGSNGSTASSVATATVGGASITSFTVSPNTADMGSDVSVTLTWESVNTDSCYGSWPNSDDLLSSGTDIINYIDIQNSINFTLICINVFDEATDTASLTVNDVSPACDVTLTSRRDKEWTSLFSSVWPMPTSRETRVAIPETGYYAVRFETGDYVDTGAVSTFEASGSSGTRLLSISETPGCFDVADECKTGGRKTSIGWDTTGEGSGCQLKHNTVYYWNITFTDGAIPGSSSCLGTFCETYLWVINSD